MAEGDRTGGEYDLVGAHLFTLTAQGHVHKVRLVPQVLEGRLDALLGTKKLAIEKKVKNKSVNTKYRRIGTGTHLVTGRYRKGYC